MTLKVFVFAYTGGVLKRICSLNDPLMILHGVVPTESTVEEDRITLRPYQWPPGDMALSTARVYQELMSQAEVPMDVPWVCNFSYEQLTEPLEQIMAYSVPGESSSSAKLSFIYICMWWPWGFFAFFP